MASQQPRFIETKEIPHSLWNPELELNSSSPKGALRLPQILVDAYREALDHFNLMETAMDEKKRNLREIGGFGRAESREHFACRYSGSCGRTQLYFLDPHLTLKTTREDLVEIFSGGEVSILDIPVGAGSGAAALISIIAQLRHERVLPRLPLSIHVTGGDISETSLKIARRIFRNLTPRWKEAGIEVKHDFVIWNVESDESSGDLEETWSTNSSNKTRILLGNNFSGFLGQPITPNRPERKIDEVSSSLSLTFTAAARNRSRVFWIEPIDKNAKRTIQSLRKLLDRYSRIQHELPEDVQSTAELHDPLIGEFNFTVRTSGLHLKPPVS